MELVPSSENIIQTINWYSEALEVCLLPLPAILVVDYITWLHNPVSLENRNLFPCVLVHGRLNYSSIVSLSRFTIGDVLLLPGQMSQHTHRAQVKLKKHCTDKTAVNLK